MTYELAKQLKDAGFPQEGGGDVRCNCTDEQRRNGYPNCDDVYLPTFSELIEACRGSKQFHFNGLFERAKNWVANGFRDASCCETCGATTGRTQSFEEYGSTPEESVAELWLALNRKSGT